MDYVLLKIVLRFSISLYLRSTWRYLKANVPISRSHQYNTTLPQHHHNSSSLVLACLLAFIDCNSTEAMAPNTGVKTDEKVRKELQIASLSHLSIWLNLCMLLRYGSRCKFIVRYVSNKRMSHYYIICRNNTLMTSMSRPTPFPTKLASSTLSPTSPMISIVKCSTLTSCRLRNLSPVAAPSTL